MKITNTELSVNVFGKSLSSVFLSAGLSVGTAVAAAFSFTCAAG